jgi:hypothetical protein
MASRRVRLGRFWAALLISLFLGTSPGCGDSDSGVTETDAKTRLTHVLQLYQAYVDTNRSGPPDAEALKQFAQSLTAEQREAYLLPEDLQTIWVSPRDNQPFVIEYGQNLQAGGDPFAIAWEAVGANGMRYVALSMGYVEEYDEATFSEYRKKK